MKSAAAKSGDKGGSSSGGSHGVVNGSMAALGHVALIALAALVIGVWATGWVRDDGPWTLLGPRLAEHGDLRPIVELSKLRDDDAVIVIGSADFLNNAWDKLHGVSLAPVHLPVPDQRNINHVLQMMEHRGLSDRALLIEARDEFFTNYGRPRLTIQTVPKITDGPLQAGAIQTVFTAFGRASKEGLCCQPLPRPEDYNPLSLMTPAEDSPLTRFAERGRTVFVTLPKSDALPLTNAELDQQITAWKQQSGWTLLPQQDLAIEALPEAVTAEALHETKHADVTPTGEDPADVQ
ncbi:MAG: hypothetical protein Alpg2KO_24700 [Alphaproteobacteria bacterium]